MSAFGRDGARQRKPVCTTQPADLYGKMYHVFTRARRLCLPQPANAVRLGPEDVSALAVNAGLFEWLMEKVSRKALGRTKACRRLAAGHSSNFNR